MTSKALATVFIALPLAIAPAWTGAAERDPQPGFLEKASREVQDAYILGRLNTAYALSEYLSPFDIDVDVKDGRVTLSGTLASDIERDLAVEIAKGAPRVRNVESNLQVAPKGADDGGQPAPGFARTFRDATTTARVKTKLLANGNTGGLGINVDTEDRIVTLTGSVQSGIERELAVQIARNTEGVSRVVDKLSVPRS